MTQYIANLDKLESSFHTYDVLDVWLQAIGLVGTAGTADYQWFSSRIKTLTTSLSLKTWEDVFKCIKRVLWLDSPNSEAMFSAHWTVLSKE